MTKRTMYPPPEAPRGVYTPYDILKMIKEREKKEEEEWAARSGPVTIRKKED